MIFLADGVSDSESDDDDDEIEADDSWKDTQDSEFSVTTDDGNRIFLEFSLIL
jgi:hypothetical protein